MKFSPRYFYLLFIPVWCIAAWLGAVWYANQKIDALVESNQTAMESDSLALFQAFEERLNYLATVPFMIGQLPSVADAAHRYSHVAALNRAGRDPKAYWSGRPDLQALNEQFKELVRDLQVDVVFLLNTEGYCIASSNSDTPASFVGTRYDDRGYFRNAITGDKAHQYAVGRKTNIPGLFYSAPVITHGETHGVIVIKSDITNFQGLLAPYHAYLTDANDVIVLSSQPKYLQHILSHARFLELDEADRQRQYKRSEFPVLPMQPWNGNSGVPLIRLNAMPYPVLTTERQIPGGDLVSHLFQAVPELPVVQRERYVFAGITAVAGIAVLGLLLQLIQYLKHLRASKTSAEAESVKLHETLSDRERELQRLAFVDTLTQLPNRNALLEHLASMIPEFVSGAHFGALFLINMDSLKLINDRLGHSAGDKILVELATRLPDPSSPNTYVARLAGDEFVVLAHSNASTREAATRAVTEFGHALLSRITAPYLINDHTVHMTASVGVTLFGPGLTVQPDVLLTEIDAAMFEAKHSHRGGIHFFDDQVRQTLEGRADMANRLIHAVRSNLFEQVYQPQMDTQGCIAGVEALIRWQDETLGAVSPATFIPLAETLHIIADIDRWVLNRACQTAGSWRQSPLLRQVPISINVSGEFFGMKGFVDEVASVAAAHKADPSQIMIELTEGTLITDSEQNQKTIAELHRLGFQVAIDDFGTGNSSLSYMRRFNVDQLKIDQSFVRDMLTDERSLAIVEFIIRLATSLNYKTLAEGVETTPQFEKLSELGCTLFQGYLFSKPLPLNACESYIHQSSGTPSSAQ